MDAIAAIATDENDRPLEDVTILSVTVETYTASKSVPVVGEAFFHHGPSDIRMGILAASSQGWQLAGFSSTIFLISVDPFFQTARYSPHRR